MSAQVISTRHLSQALEAEGYALPAGCREVRLVMGVNVPFLLQFDCFVSDADLAKVGRAFQRIAAASAAPPPDDPDGTGGVV